MNRVTLQQLQALWDNASQPCVSIYLPTHRMGAGTEANRILLKNLLRRAQSQLEALTPREAERRALLAPLEELVAEQTFWKEQDAGLALFRSPEHFVTFNLQHTPPERLVVAERFHVRPLLPSLRAQQAFHVLALSLNAVRLLRADGGELRVEALPEAPDSLEDFLRFEDAQPDAQYRQAGEGGTFGGGGHQADRKDEQRRYVRAVARAVGRHLQDCSTPLVFAGVEELFALYREASTGNHLLPRAITGNPDRVPAEALRTQAQPLMQSLGEAERSAAADAYRRLTRAGKALTGLPHALRAAREGRVDTLMTRPEAECWGQYTPERDAVEMHNRPKPGDDELLDLAVSMTLRAGGRWLPLPEELAQSPTLRDGVAAVLRY